MAEVAAAELYPSSQKISTLHSFDTEFSADSVEWCPHEPLQHFFVCGNYQLSQDETTTGLSQRRAGRILLFSIAAGTGLKLWQTLDTAAVLDQKWCHNQIDGFSILGVVNANKKLEIYKFNPQCFKLELLTFYELEQEDHEILLLSLDWSTGKYGSQEPDIICSDSKGYWHRFKFVDNELRLENSCHAHEYEAWIAAFYYWDTNRFFTGGDDSLLMAFDQRTGTQPIVKNRTASAGVTCIHSNSHKEFFVATGSYDQTISMWDIRSLKLAVGTQEMPGPLWRLKWDPHSFNYLLAACMKGGAHIVEARDVTDMKIVESYYGHKDITYGADWSYLPESELSKFEFEGNRIIGTCSFYDHLLCVSKLTL